MPARCRLCLSLVTLLAAGVAPANVDASDRTGIYAIIDRVELLPNADAPTEAKIFGLFSVSHPRSHPKQGHIAPPVIGYLYLTLVPEKEAECRTEWKDLGRVAGTGKIIGFGRRHDDMPIVRPPSPNKPRIGEKPDPHPVGWGIHDIRSRNHYRAADLRYYPVPKLPMTSIEFERSQQLELVVHNCRSDNPNLRYFFVVEEIGGRLHASGPIEPGDRETRWKPTIWLQKPGVEYRWWVHVHDPDRPIRPNAGSSSITYPVAHSKFTTRKKTKPMVLPDPGGDDR